MCRAGLRLRRRGGSLTLRAVVLDVDGTLYDQRPLRLAMAWRLGRYCAGSPREGLPALRIIRAYRRAQEVLRHAVPGREPLAGWQLRIAAESVGVEEELVRQVVERWMEREPLDLLRRGLRPGLGDFLAEAKRRGLRLAALSDYPLRAKLGALGLEAAFDARVCAQDPEVNRLKPDPRGLRVALARLDAAAAEALYVGDRPDVDAAAARAAGMRCVIVGCRGRRGEGWVGVGDFRELAELELAGSWAPSP